MTEDHNRGKIVWPIAVGECPDIDDAYKTLYSLSAAALYLSFYDEKGAVLTDELSVEFQNIYENDDLGRFARKSLKELIEFQLEIHEEDGEEPQARKLKRLLQVLEEP